jgi:phage/plasmid-like protein (TIGR03299 family)
MSIFSKGIAVNPNMTISQQLEQAKLDWTVEIANAVYQVGNGDFIRSDKTKIAYRSETLQELSHYGTTRNAYQNREIVETFNEFTQSNGLKIDRLGSLDGGKRVFCLSELPVEVNPIKAVGDITKAYLLLTESHIHGQGTLVSVYFDRLVCTNGMVRNVKELEKSTNHASSFNAERLTNMLEMAYNQVNKYEQDLKCFAETNITRQEAIGMLISNFGDAKLELSEQPKIIQVCLRLFDGQAKGGDMLTAYNTVYGLMQSVTEFTSHHVKETKTQTSSQLYGSSHLINNKMYNSLLSVYSSADIASGKVAKGKQLQTIRAW